MYALYLDVHVLSVPFDISAKSNKFVFFRSSFLFFLPFFIRMASRVMLATLAIPIPVSLSETEKHLELDEMARDKSRRLASLLGLQTIPTRASLINDMVRICFCQAFLELTCITNKQQCICRTSDRMQWCGYA